MSLYFPSGYIKAEHPHSTSHRFSVFKNGCQNGMNLRYVANPQKRSSPSDDENYHDEPKTPTKGTRNLKTHAELQSQASSISAHV
jgi:hypothetical protein